MEGEDRYKHKSVTNWILILESRGKHFDLEVTPTTYYYAQTGDILYFELSDENLDHDWGWTAAEIGGLLGLITSLGIILMSFIIRGSKTR